MAMSAARVGHAMVTAEAPPVTTASLPNAVMRVTREGSVARAMTHVVTTASATTVTVTTVTVMTDAPPLAPRLGLRPAPRPHPLRRPAKTTAACACPS
ncbi:MAG: hypothetical protein RI907_3904 [Pseudomonadota bacterium]